MPENNSSMISFKRALALLNGEHDSLHVGAVGTTCGERDIVGMTYDFFTTQAEFAVSLPRHPSFEVALSPSCARASESK